MGERLDGTWRALRDTAAQQRSFGAPPLCAGGRMFAAGDPYFDIADQYQSLPPVGVQGVLDQVAADAGEPLPARVARLPVRGCVLQPPYSTAASPRRS